ncbi:MAG: DNA (cytosine-5-)-methyltransferase [Cenarchaeum symbiont of Oopsacas minuta]|nr:DNA (cytosine-5-)-methyltransferase [Cenarchaeum symbiont of Oopsacas minuta]MDI1495871.1 DNA (cytosine-5-)-methyltransferase [Cenarchaeum symbiont of Oopsacas minuta]
MPRTPQINRLVNLRKKLESEYNNRFYVDTLKIKKLKNRLTHVDLFSGAGGNIEGMRQAGFDTLLSIEIDQDASNTIKKNFSNVNHIEGDICNIDKFEIKKIVNRKSIDVLSAGFPCQGFSIAGFQHIDDKRNILYKQVVRMVRILNPKYVVMENVPGIISMNDGNFVNDIRKLFARYGYPDMSILILESASYGIAQIRPRTIFIANRLGKKNPYPKPILQPNEFVPIESAIRDLECHNRNSKTNHEWTEHRPKMIKRLSKIKAGESLYKTYTDAAKRQYKGVPSMTIKENHGGTHIHYKLNRMISVREMARLQGFPDGFIFSGRMKRAMWQVGNAAPPPLFRHIGLALRSQLT